jgi:hypothetical protein
MEIKELRRENQRRQTLEKRLMLTFTVPSNVLAITTLLSVSLANPVIHLSFPFFLEVRRLWTTSGGQGPTLKLLRFIPDCIFHMWISPVEDPAMPKLPQAVTHTAWIIRSEIWLAIWTGNNHRP